MKGKPCAGGEVQFLDMENDAEDGPWKQVPGQVERLYEPVDLPFANAFPKKFNSYSLTHRMRLSL